MLAPSVRDLTLFFDLLAPRWDAMQTADRSARLARLLAPHASLFEDARRVLDIGTGTGAFLPHLAQLAPEARVIAVDLSPVMLDMARASAPGNAAWLLAEGEEATVCAFTHGGFVRAVMAQLLAGDDLPARQSHRTASPDPEVSRGSMARTLSAMTLERFAIGGHSAGGGPR